MGSPAPWLPRWHRRIGLAALVLVVLATVTGILINHADSLGLAQRRITSPAVLAWWGVPAPVPAAAPLGAAPVQGGWAVAMPARLLLLTPDGALADVLAYPNEALATAANVAPDGALRVTLEAQSGRAGAVVQLTADAAAWRAADTAPPSPSAAANPALPPAAGQAALAWAQSQAAQQPGLSAERVLLDIHAGRWLGPVGVWLMDAAALALLALAATGAWTWWQRWRWRRGR